MHRYRMFKSRIYKKERVIISDILFVQQLDIPRIISCKLNPLIVCNSEIVRNFANITKMYQLAYCDIIIEDNARKRLPVFGEEKFLLPDFFPFESCILERSGHRLTPLLNSNVTNASKPLENTSTNVPELNHEAMFD